MKIALIGRFGEGDILTGPERVARELSSELKRNNVQITFIEYFFSGYRNSTVLKKIFGKEALDSDGSILRLGIIPILLRLRKENFDLVHVVNSQRFLLLILLLKHFIKSKFVTTLHGFSRTEIPPDNYLLKRYFIDLWVEKLIIKKSELLVFPSKTLFEVFNHYYKISESRNKIIPNGVSSIFSKHNNPFPAIKDSLKLVFYNGFSDSINRGLNVLVDLLCKTKNKVELFVIGQREPEINSHEKVKITYVKPKAHKDFIDFMSDKHFVIKSQTFDSFPLLIAECMALGVVPIVHNNTGIKDYIEDKVNGFVYNIAPSNDLVKILDDISDGRYDLTSISSNAKKIYDKLNWENVTKYYIEAYNSIL